MNILEIMMLLAGVAVSGAGLIAMIQAIRFLKTSRQE